MKMLEKNGHLIAGAVMALGGVIAAMMIAPSAHAENANQPKPWKEYRTDNDTRTPEQKLIEAAQACKHILDKNNPDKDAENREYEACMSREYGTDGQ